jgi:nitronate monooxygenase
VRRRRARSPRGARLLGRLSAPLGRIAPIEQMGRLASLQRAGVPVFTPALPLSGMPDGAVGRCALYAGDSALRMHEIVPATVAVETLTP